MNDEEYQENTRKKLLTKPRLIKIIILIVVIALITAIIYVFISKNGAESQINELQSNIENKNDNALAAQLSTNQREMTQKEANNLIDYFNSDKHKEQFQKELHDIKSNIKKDLGSDLGQIKDQQGNPIISISKNGKQYFILDKISMEPIYRDVYVKEADNDATYNIDKKHQVSAQKQKLNKLGSFVVGKYEIPVKKEFKEGPVTDTVSGNLIIDTTKSKNGKIVAKQDFNQTQIKIKVHNDNKIESKNRNLYINDKQYNLSESKKYGYFPNDDSFEVSVKGQIDGHIFETNKVSVMEGLNSNTQTVNLYFNEKEIKSKTEADKKTRKEITDFIEDYMQHLNKAYEKTQYRPIKEDIKVGSKAESFMKPKFEKKQKIKYTSTKVNKIKKNNDQYEVEVSKKYKSNPVKTIYTIEKDTDSFKITKMEDKT
ncbi:TcaA second domain-containing protein [Mammaliicoccus vitulinus]|uniref:TcaA second domain-containing protein n=1 Tax=Mammaliicoccus vitulinus TaxID=71237 RepID=UPI00248C6C3F|nr:hypothetical protein [Mammaliicoccus vitulinus]